jgi:peptidoglycan hydrolase CwlO-like protein
MLLIGSALLASEASAQEQDPAAKQAELEQKKAALSGEIDGLKASSEQLVSTVSALNSQLVEQQAAVDRAAKATSEASNRVTEARANEQAARDQFVVTQQRLRAVAVSAYVGPPGEAAAAVLLGGPLDEAPTRRVLAGVRLEQITKAVNDLKVVRAEAERVRSRLQEAEAAARQAEADQTSRLGELTASQEAHRVLLEQVATRLDGALAESNQLSAEEAALASQIRAHEEELNHRLLMASNQPAVTPSGTGGQQPGGGGATAVPSRTAASPSPGSSPPPTAPISPAQNRTVQITPVETTWVGGIEVATQIAGQLADLLAAARASGLILTGSGYRNIYDQIAIRKQYCGTTDYDIWDRPSWECSPPVARPGRSMHEKGVAVDFTGPDGDLVRTHASPTYQWLAANAARFGFYNLPSEPWHWSITGT